MLSKDTNGETPLHYAALKGKLSVMELLLDKGADMLAKAF